MENMTRLKQLYAAKLAWGALVLAALLIIRSGIFLAVGIVQGFQGDIPWGRFGLFTLISWAVSMMVYALQQGLSLRFLNQAAPWCAASPEVSWASSPCSFLQR